MQVLNFFVLAFALAVFSPGGVKAACTDAACSTACDLVSLNNGAPGHCDATYKNGNFGNDPSCVCDACPATSLPDFTNPAVIARVCVGSLAQSQCNACPPSNLLGDVFIPHICTVTPPGGVPTQLCVCMCGNGPTTLTTLTTCPFKTLFSGSG